MELKHDFTVPASVEDTWKAFNDLEMVAGCFPGAALTSVEGDDFKGTCKVKLGPISLLYSGTGTFLERDADGHRFVLEAKGKDKRGNGTAGATVTASLQAEGESSTRASVVTDLSITGKPAQFGRGVIQDVSDKLLGQFIACLESKVGPVEEVPAEPMGAEAPPLAEAGAAAPAAAPAEAGAAPLAGVADGIPTGARKAPASTYAGVSAGREVGGGEEALDLGATVLPILLRAYWKQLAGGVLVLVVLRWLIGRRRR